MPEKLTFGVVNEDDFLISVLRVNNRPIAESLELYRFKDTFLIPVKQIGFLFNVDWIFDEQKLAFYSDFNQSRKHQLCSFSIKFSKDSVSSTFFWYEDDFETYIDAKIVAKLLHGEISFNAELQQLNFSSAYSEIGYSKTKQQPIFAHYNEVLIEEYPIVRSQYKRFTSPIINYNLSLNESKTNKLAYSANVNTYFDVFGFASEARITSSQYANRQFLKFSKNILMSETDEHQLGNVQTIDDHVIKYEFGDVSVSGDELLSPAKLALGATLFSYAQNTRRNFSSIRIEETALPGYRAILFRNGQFVSEQIVDDAGLIVFDSIATFYGVNTFRLHLYGPEGQEEFREKVVHVGKQQKQASQFDFSVSASDASESIFNPSANKSIFDKQINANASYGLTDKLTLNAQWLELPSNKNNQRFLSTSADYADYNSLFRLKYARGADKGQALFAGINTNINEYFSGNLNYRYFDDFDSELYQKAQDLKQELQFRVLSRIKPLQMGVNFSFSEKRFVDKAVQRSIGLQSNQFKFGGTFSNSLQFNQWGDYTSFSHRIFMTNTINQWQFRHSLTWEPFDGANISNYSLNIRWPHKGKLFNESKLDYQKSNKAKHSISHRMSWQTDFFVFQVGATVDSDTNWQLKLGITGSFYKSKQSQSFKFARNKGSDSRRIEAIAFIDANRDGEFSEEEEKLQNIEFAGQASWRNSTSSEEGFAELFTRSDYQKISIRENSLDDPFLASHDGTKIVASHPGSHTKVFFPLSAVNEIEGEVKIIDSKNEGGVLGLSIQLSNAAQDEFFYAQTDSEGYFYFQQIPPGTYTLSIDNEQLKRLNISNFKSFELHASDIGDIITVDTIELRTTKAIDLSTAK